MVIIPLWNNLLIAGLIFLLGVCVGWIANNIRIEHETKNFIDKNIKK